MLDGVMLTNISGNKIGTGFVESFGDPEATCSPKPSIYTTIESASEWIEKSIKCNTKLSKSGKSNKERSKD